MLNLRPLFISALLLLPSVSAYASGTHWSYKGDQGPAHWGEESTLCVAGNAQSPIDINVRIAQKQKITSDTLQINYQRPLLKLINNGHTVQANSLKNESLIFHGKIYRLVQFHFHTPSEHLIDHRTYPMEMHLVNQADDGRLLVLGVMIAEGQKNTELAQLWRAMPEQKEQEVSLSAADAPNLAKLLPQDSHHFFYSGSLTTPPCDEGVQWVVYQRPIEMSAEQIARFQTLYPDNHRPARVAKDREVDED